MRRFAQVDVFTAHPGLGNPVAVVLDAEGLADATMARLANWTNLSETTFVLPPTEPGADYRVRIFTPAVELPLAGHPTIGTCRALIDAGMLPERPERGEWVQQSSAGLVAIRPSADGTLSYASPPAIVSASPVTDVLLERVLGVRPAEPLLIETGPRWLTGRVSVKELAGLQIDEPGFRATVSPQVAIGVTLYAVDDDPNHGDNPVVHVRSFFWGGAGLVEDPVCGSGNVAVGVHLRQTKHEDDVPPVYQARQGSHLGRDGRITVTLGDQVWVGGQAVTVVSGTIAI